MKARLRFGERLDELIRDAGMTQETFAAAADVSQGSVSNWINHVSLPDRGNAKAIARVLGLDLDELNDWITTDRKLRATIRRREEVRPAGKGLLEAIRLGRVPFIRPQGWDIESERRMIDLPAVWLTDMRSPVIAVEVDGEGLTDRGIYHGDWIICERVTDPRSVPQGKVALVCVADECALKVLTWVGYDQAELTDGSGAVTVSIADGSDVEVLGIARKRYGDI